MLKCKHLDTDNDQTSYLQVSSRVVKRIEASVNKWNSMNNLQAFVVHKNMSDEIDFHYDLIEKVRETFSVSLFKLHAHSRFTLVGLDWRARLDRPRECQIKESAKR
jgi:hypothetical protein